jgi:hypothetical protein
MTHSGLEQVVGLRAAGSWAGKKCLASYALEESWIGVGCG